MDTLKSVVKSNEEKQVRTYIHTYIRNYVQHVCVCLYKPTDHYLYYVHYIREVAYFLPQCNCVCFDDGFFSLIEESY